MAPGSKLDKIVRKLYVKKEVNCLRESPLGTEIKEKKNLNPRWNYHKDCQGRYQFEKSCKKSLPGSYRAVLNRKTRKSEACLWFDTKSEKSDRLNHEGKYLLLAAMNTCTPILKYSKSCILCKKEYIYVKMSKKIWRQSLTLDRKMTQLGAMISRNMDDFSVHQVCLDYAYGEKVVQNYKEEPAIEKLDGYPIEVIKAIRGTKCAYCQNNRAVTACAAKTCRKFYHLPCGIQNGSLQIAGQKRSFCHQHASKHFPKHSTCQADIRQDDHEITEPTPGVSNSQKIKSRKKHKPSSSACSTPTNSQELISSSQNSLKILSSYTLISTSDNDQNTEKRENIELIDVSTLPDPDPFDPYPPRIKKEMKTTWSEQEQLEEVKNIETIVFPESPDSSDYATGPILPMTENCKLCDEETAIPVYEFVDHVVTKHLVLKSEVSKSIIYPVDCREKNCRRSLDNAKDLINHLTMDHNKARIHYEKMVKMHEKEKVANAQLVSKTLATSTITSTITSSGTTVRSSLANSMTPTTSLVNSPSNTSVKRPLNSTSIETSKSSETPSKKRKSNDQNEIVNENDSNPFNPAETSAIESNTSSPNASKSSPLQTLKEEIQQLNLEIAKLRQENQRLQTNFQELAMSKQVLLMKNAELEMEKEASKEENQTIEEQNEALKAENNVINDEKKSLKEEIDKMKRIIERARNVLNQD